MNCTDFDAWLHDTADERERVLSEAASRHVADCQACRTLWSSETALDRAFALWKAAPLPSLPDNVLAERIVAHVLPRQLRAPISRSRPRSWMTVVAALAVLVAAGIALLRQSEPGTPIAAVRPPPMEPAVPLSESVAAVWNDMRTTSQLVVWETVESLDHLAQLPAVAPTPTSVEIEHPTVPAPPTWLPWSEPIGEQVNAGFGFLGEVVPMPTAG